YTAFATLVEIFGFDLLDRDIVDPTRSRHYRDQHILVADLAAQFQARPRLCACGAVSERSDALLWESSPTASAVARRRSRGRDRGAETRTKNHRYSVSRSWIDRRT